MPEGPPVPGSAAQQVSSRLTDILRAAPDLRYSTGLVYALALHGGDHVENAQSVAGVAKAHALTVGTHRVANGVGPDALPDGLTPADLSFARRTARQASAGPPAPLGSAPSGILDDIGGAASAVGHFVGAIPRVATNLATGANNPTGPSGQSSGAGGIAPGVTTPQFTAGVQQQVGGDVGAATEQFSPNQVFQVPSHIYRYLYDVNARHGPAAAVLAAVPLIGGATLGYALTHSPKGAEEGGTLAAEATGVASEATGAAKASEVVAPSSAATGQAARSVTNAVLSPAVAAVRGPVRALTAVSSSPTVLGGEGVAMVSGHVLFPQSWQRTADATTWKLPNGTIGPTFGQTVAGAVGLTKGATLYNALSGSLDGFMALAVPDPAGAGGRVFGKATSAEGIGGYLGTRWGGTAAMTPEGVAAADAQYPRVRAALNDIANLTPGAIVAKYPEFSKIADQLGAASTHDEALHVFQNAARTQEILTTSTMPQLGAYSKAKSVMAKTTTLGTSAPTAFDADVQKFVGRTLPMGSPEAAPAVYAMLRASGETQTAARQVAGVIAGSRDPFLNITAVKNATKVLIGRKVLAALPRGHEELGSVTLARMNELVDELYGGAGAGRTGQFGRSMDGADLSTTYSQTEEDKSYASAIWFNQADQMTVPSVREVKQVVLDLAQMEDWTAKNAVLSRGLAWEQFIDHTLNERIFQPLALATMGWATRVSISEAAMNILRQGPLNFTAGRIAASAAKQNWAIATKEMPHFVAAVHGVLAGIDESAVRALGKDRILDAATASMKMFNGHVVHPALDSTHTPIARGTDMPGMAASDIISKNRRIGAAPTYRVRGRPLDDTYTLLAPGNTGYFRSWSEYAGRIAHDKFGETVAKDYADALDSGMSEVEASSQTVQKATAWLDALPTAEKSHMVRNYARSAAGREQGLTTSEDWAVQAVSALKGTIYGKDGTLHNDLLYDIVDKQVPEVKGMTERYGQIAEHKLPQAMPGREVSMNVLNPITTVTNTLHSKLLGPIVNALSREPTWVVDFANERKLFEPLVKEGSVTQDQADVVAAERAIHKSIRFVHNPLDRTKIENMLHTFAPFYFAQNQALRRAGRLFATNPGAFEQYLKAGLAVANQARVITAQNGFPTAVIPGSTISGEGITGALHLMGINPVGGIPVGLTGGVDVSSTISPFAASDSDITGPAGGIASALKPSFGPVAAIPLRAIDDFFSARAPKISQAAQKLLGPVSSTQPFWTQGVPNSFIVHAIQGTMGYATQGENPMGSSYTTGLLSTMAAMAAQGALPGAKDLQGGGFPNNSPAKAAFIKRANNVQAILWVGRTLVGFGSPVSVSLGQAGLEFTNMAQDYINKAGGNVNKGLEAMTKAHPDLVPYEVFKSTASDGYAYPEVQKAANWIGANRALVDKYKAAARWLLPNTDTTGRFSDSAYNMELAMGLRSKLTPSEFFDQLYIASGNSWYFDKLDPQIKAAVAKDPGQAHEIYAKADDIAAHYGATVNPIWQDYWTGKESTNKRQQVEAQIETMLEDPATPHTKEAVRLSYLVNLYRQFQGSRTQGAYSSSQAKAIWTQTMTDFVSKYPDTKTVVQTVFLGLG